MKMCYTCGRVISRKVVKEEQKYCSQSCRRDKPGLVDQKIEEAIMEKLKHGPCKISDVELNERTKRAARRIINNSDHEFVCKENGKIADVSFAKGDWTISRP